MAMQATGPSGGALGAAEVGVVVSTTVDGAADEAPITSSPNRLLALVSYACV